MQGWILELSSEIPHESERGIGILCGNKMIHLLDDSCHEKLLKLVTIRLLYLISLKEKIYYLSKFHCMNSFL